MVRKPAAWFSTLVALSLAGISSCSTQTQPAPRATNTSASPGGLERPASAPAAVVFDRAEFLSAMNRLHQFYMATEGLQRPNGLSIGGAPDLVGIAAWIFDVYLTCRAA